MTVAERIRRRDRALRRTHAIVAAVAAGAVGLSGLASVVAAQAFKGHQKTTPAPARAQRPRASQQRAHVPGPQAIPPIAGEPAPLQPPSQPPAAQTPAPAPAPPAPQVSGGS
jgi:hypothetical protein